MNALQQTGWTGPMPEAGNWRALLAPRLQQIDGSRVEADLEPFLEEPREMELISRENALRILTQ